MSNRMLPDDDGRYTLTVVSRSTPVAQKVRLCESCSESLPIGRSYVRTAIRDPFNRGGSVFSIATHAGPCEPY